MYNILWIWFFCPCEMFYGPSMGGVDAICFLCILWWYINLFVNKVTLFSLHWLAWAIYFNIVMFSLCYTILDLFIFVCCHVFLYSWIFMWFIYSFLSKVSMHNVLIFQINEIWDCHLFIYLCNHKLSGFIFVISTGDHNVMDYPRFMIY